MVRVLLSQDLCHLEAGTIQSVSACLVTTSQMVEGVSVFPAVPAFTPGFTVTLVIIILDVVSNKDNCIMIYVLRLKNCCKRMC